MTGETITVGAGYLPFPDLSVLRVPLKGEAPIDTRNRAKLSTFLMGTVVHGKLLQYPSKAENTDRL